MITLINHSSKDQLDLAPAEEIVEQLADHPMAGWLELPWTYDREEIKRIKSAAKTINQTSKYLVCIGIGGSYLGHRALIEALGESGGTEILYAGNSLSPLALRQVLETLGDADFSVNVISKSGTTTEPAIAFRIFKQKLIDKYGEREAYARIFATTDADSGALHDEAVKNGYQTFTIPDDVGGRFSVLTPVGLLPLAVAGIDLDELMRGAEDQSKSREDIYHYALLRQQLYRNGHDVEVLATFEPELQYFTEWWKQLFGESEGKDNKGIFPASAVYSTDLHSLGQFMQDGRPDIFETILDVEHSGEDITIPSDPDNLDNLNYLAGESLGFVNHQALRATVEAHSKHLPVLELKVPALSAHTFGALIYFFELACAISATVQGVNPFDQPGVEEYKQAMFKLLGKPVI